MSWFRRFGTSKEQPPRPITVVSGLPRSGTSMLMKMLAAGGMEILTDNQRTADDDNPEGYYEFERVKGLDKGDTAWLPEARGKVVKVISALLRHLPPQYQYKVIFMRRRLSENLASQKKMLQRRDEATDKISDAELMVLLEKHLRQVDTWLTAQPNIEVLTAHYHEMVEDPRRHAEAIQRFLGADLNVDAMAGVADQKLYRNR